MHDKETSRYGPAMNVIECWSVPPRSVGVEQHVDLLGVRVRTGLGIEHPVVTGTVAARAGGSRARPRAGFPG